MNISASVTSIEATAFSGCYNLTNVTFESTIASNKFGAESEVNLGQWQWISPFSGDLRDKHLAGGPGTYTTEDGRTWTKQ